MARPTIYSPEDAQRICERLMEGESLRRICADEDMPSRATVLRWLATDHDGFEAKYAQARVAQLYGEADDILEIADNSANDWMERHGKDDVGWQLNGDNIQRAKLRIESRKWLLCKLIPKKYGDKIEQTLQGPNGQPVAMSLTVEFIKPPSADSAAS